MSSYKGSKAFQGLGSQLSIGPTASTTPPTGLTGSTTSSSAAITISAAGASIGMGISGPGIPPGTTLLSGSGTSFTMSANATATASGVALTFTNVYVPIFELTNQPFKAAEWDKLEVSNFNSINGFKEYIKGMADSGTVPIEGNTVATDPGQIAVAAAFADKANAYQFQLQLPLQSGQTTTGDKYTFNALVMSWTPLGDFDPKKATQIKGEIQITGGITYTAGS